MKKSAARASNRQLFFIFILSLPVFLLFRWDSSTWLKEKVDAASKESGYGVTYSHISLSGLGVEFQGLSLSKTNTPTLHFDSIAASLSVSHLLSAHLAADIDAVWQGNPVTFTVAQDGEQIVITNIEAVIDLNRVETLKQSVPAQLAGLVEARGEVTINQTTQLPQSLHLNVLWNQAMAGLATPEFTLGDYTAQLDSNEDAGKPWAWNISGGSGVALQGQGSIFPQNPNPNLWGINGSLDVNVSQTNPSLAMMMQTMGGSNPAKVRIFGTLSQPRTDFIR